MRLAGNEPDHQTMFLHFSNYESKEHGKSVLGGQWIAGISKQNNMKRNCAEHKHFHFLLCLFLVHPIWSMFCQMLLLVSSGPNICAFRFFTLSIFGSPHLVHVLFYRCSCQFHLVSIFVFLDFLLCQFLVHSIWSMFCYIDAPVSFIWSQYLCFQMLLFL